MSELDGLIEALNEAHEFPCRYVFKVIGPNDSEFTEGAVAVVRAALPNQEPELSRRETKSGGSQSVTLVVEATSAEVVASIHEALGRIPRVRFVL